MTEVILNCTQHKATYDQINKGVMDIVVPYIRKKVVDLITFEEIPTQEILKYQANTLANYLIEINKTHYQNQINKVMIGGAPYFMSHLEKALKNAGFTPVYAFSKRVCKEEHQPDGTVKKTFFFKHLGFVEV